MAITLEKFIKVTNAEEVAGNVIIGIMADRKIVGSVTDGVFSFNDDGKKIIEEIEAGTYGVDAAEEAPAEEPVVKATKPVKAAK